MSRRLAVLVIFASFLLLRPGDAFLIERPALLRGSETHNDPERRCLIPSPPHWVGNTRRSQLLMLPSKRFCDLALQVSLGKVPVRKRTREPLRLDVYIVMTTHEGKDSCSMLLKARAAESLGAEGFLIEEMKAPVDQETYVKALFGQEMHWADPVLDMPVELILQEEYALLAAAVLQGIDVVATMGQVMETTRFFCRNARKTPAWWWTRGLRRRRTR